MTSTTAPIQELHINPEYQELIQPLTNEEYQLLKNSIREQGQHIPIIANTKGTVIDGHHRYKIDIELGIAPKVEIRAFATPLDEKLCIIDCNLKRRHLTDAQKIEIGHRIKPVYQELAKRNESLGGKGVSPDTPLGRVDEVVAKEVGLSKSTFQRGEMILVDYPDAFEKYVKKDHIPIGRVHNKIKLQEKKERLRGAARNSTVQIPKGCELIFGDFIEKSKEIPDEYVDLLFTDPPYDKESIHLYGEVAKIAERVLKPGASFLVLAGYYIVPECLNLIREAGLNYNDIICVKYPTGGHDPLHKSHVFNDWKPLLWYKKGDKLAQGLPYISNFVESGHPNKDLHEWQQGPDEAEYVIKSLTVENQIVFDPMMGSGTTGIVALRLNRQFIGIEQNEETFNIARGNITKESKK